MANLLHMRALVVKKDILDALEVEEFLFKLGVGGVETAGNRDDAFRMIKESGIGLLLVDAVLNEGNGLELIVKLRCQDDKEVATVPAILLAQNPDERWKLAAQKAGVNAILEVPFDLRTLESVLNDVLTQDRQFVRSRNYVGPDRRAEPQKPYPGPDRRRG